MSLPQIARIATDLTAVGQVPGADNIGKHRFFQGQEVQIDTYHSFLKNYIMGKREGAKKQGTNAGTEKISSGHIW